jgi:hypothetical protein
MDKKIGTDKNSPQEEGHDMSTLAIDNKSLQNFINQNKEKIYKEARQNTKLNAQGKATISKDDPWFQDDKWDEHFKRMDNE